MVKTQNSRKQKTPKQTCKRNKKQNKRAQQSRIRTVQRDTIHTREHQLLPMESHEKDKEANNTRPSNQNSR